jgi:hypothetical protein
MLRLTVLLLSLFVVNGCARSGTSQTETSTNALRSEHPSPTPAASAAASSPQQASTAASSPQLKPKLDACAMLTSEEIQSIQGEALKEAKLSEGSGNGLRVSQCFFSLPTFTNSISLAITQKADGPGARDPKQFWKESFHSGKQRNDGDREKDREKEEGEESRPPQKISGIGDEAFWMASRAAGILYVLKDSSYIRISIGGGGDQQTKIRKAKALARKVMDRL